MKYDFATDLSIGHKFEDLFLNHLVRKGIPKHWITKAEGLFHDWDIKVTIPNGEELTYEIKRDYHFKRTGNILYELWSCVETQSKGWALLTRAKVLVIFYTDTEFVQVTLKELCWWFRHRPELWDRREITQQNGTTTRFWLLHKGAVTTDYLYHNNRFIKLQRTLQLTWENINTK